MFTSKNSPVSKKMRDLCINVGTGLYVCMHMIPCIPTDQCSGLADMNEKAAFIWDSAIVGLTAASLVDHSRNIWRQTVEVENTGKKTCNISKRFQSPPLTTHIFTILKKCLAAGLFTSSLWAWSDPLLKRALVSIHFKCMYCFSHCAAVDVCWHTF